MTLLKTVGLLAISNTFMTIAWYGHLKHKSAPLIAAIVLSWSIALIEYAFQVPANRIGSAQYSVTQLKVVQECVSLLVFLVYVWLAFREPLRWNTALAMVLIFIAVWLTFSSVGPHLERHDSTQALAESDS